MIFHTCADSIYYDKFYDFYSLSIKKFYPNATLSLHYIGEDIPKNDNIKYLSTENLTLKSIQKIYNVDKEKDAQGYYCLSRWTSLPNVKDNIIVSDTDIIAVKTIDQNKFLEIFDKHQVINITRTKKNGSEGGMAMIAIRSDIVDEARSHAQKLLRENKLTWELDVLQRLFLYENFNVAEIPEMHVLGKSSNFENFDNTDRSFVIRKGNTDSKIHTLQQAFNNL